MFIASWFSKKQSLSKLASGDFFIGSVHMSCEHMAVVDLSSQSWHKNPLQMLHKACKLLTYVDACNICDNFILTDV